MSQESLLESAPVSYILFPGDSRLTCLSIAVSPDNLNIKDFKLFEFEYIPCRCGGEFRRDRGRNILLFFRF